MKFLKNNYPLFLYASALILLLMNTLPGVAGVGSDIHRCIFMSQRALDLGWDLQYPYEQSNVSFVVGWLVPMVAKISHIPVVWVYKLLLPAFFALVPVILYYAYSKMIDKKLAFYAAAFFAIMPAFFMEMSQIGKSMFGEVFFALALLIMVSKVKYKIPLMMLCVVIATFAHYSLGVVVVGILFGTCLVLLITYPFRKKWAVLDNRQVSLKGLIAVVLIAGISGYSFYNWADKGEIIHVIQGNSSYYGEVVSGGTDTSITQTISTAPPIVKAALGMDFAGASPMGKAFRLVQYLTQLLIIIGLFVLLIRWKRYKFTTEFTIGIGGCFLILLFCIILPSFSAMLNMTRWYHLALFYLAPLLVLGASVFKKDIVPYVLIAYLFFTSGFAYWLTGSKVVSSPDLPYSVLLGGQQNGLIAVWNQDDLNCVKWLQKQEGKIVADLNGFQLLSEYIDKVPRLKDELLDLRRTLEQPKPGEYLFVPTWNSKNNLMVEDGGIGAGLRVIYPLPEMNYKIAYQSGKSIVYVA
jgi:uncharacterized membrane protein